MQLTNISLRFASKACFTDFSTNLFYGNKVAIIGCNGSGKTSLLKIIAGLMPPTSGRVSWSQDICIGYVPQIIDTHLDLSGGQRFNVSLNQELLKKPDLLLLDEPTNHLDLHQRKSCMQRLDKYPGTLLIVSHDVDLLQNCIDTIWHIEEQKVHVFNGRYIDYIAQININRLSTQKKIEFLNKQTKDLHVDLMREQLRAKKSKARGQKSIDERKWATLVSKSKVGRSLTTAVNKKAMLKNKKAELIVQLGAIRAVEIIKPKFSLTSADLGTKTILVISNGIVGYTNNILITNISLSVAAGDKIAIAGNNASGKTTLIKAILSVPEVIRSGDWLLPRHQDLGYMDQHYATLQPDKTVLETIAELVPEWPHTKIRLHLSDFLFRGNDEVNVVVSSLSGGEKAKLSLAKIAAKTPKILILDEITNNLDLETRAHVLQVLQAYPGAMLVISHDLEFLRELDIKEHYEIKNAQLHKLWL